FLISTLPRPTAPTILPLHSPGALRHLHSFPTRRSSDLPTDALTFNQHHIPLRVTLFGLQRSPKSSVTTTDHKQVGFDVAVQTRRDRKSSRLNSSHVSISYAVFCLKKKTVVLVVAKGLNR